MQRFLAVIATTCLLGACSATPPPMPLQTLQEAAYVPMRITVDEYKARKQENMLLVDVRAPEVYEIEHAEGAVSVPWKTLPTGYAQLPKERLLLLYCT